MDGKSARRGTGVFIIVKGRQETEITRWIGKRQLENEEEEKKTAVLFHRAATRQRSKAAACVGCSWGAVCKGIHSQPPWKLIFPAVMSGRNETEAVTDVSRVRGGPKGEVRRLGHGCDLGVKAY